MIIVTSITTPFLRFWSRNIVAQRQKLKSDSDKNSDYVGALRNPLYCQSMLKGTILSPPTTLQIPIPGLLDPDFSLVLRRWNYQYERLEYERPKDQTNTKMKHLNHLKRRDSIEGAQPLLVRTKSRRDLETKKWHDMRLHKGTDIDTVDNPSSADKNDSKEDDEDDESDNDSSRKRQQTRNTFIPYHPFNLVLNKAQRAHFSDDEDRDEDRNNSLNASDDESIDDEESTMQHREKFRIQGSYLPKIYTLKNLLMTEEDDD